MKHKKYYKLISAFIDDEITEKENRKLQKHLEVCDECREYLQDLRKLQNFSAPKKREPIDLNSNQIISNFFEKQPHFSHNFKFKLAISFCVFLFFVTSMPQIYQKKNMQVSLWPDYDNNIEKEVLDIYYPSF